jgi:autotransporter translocation and assembly factor TamB
LRAPHANLADFNDAFDRAGTFAGTGHVAIDADLRTATTSGDIAFSGARFREFPLGDLGATWHTVGRDVTANGHVTGSHGTATLAGTVTLPSDPQRDPFRRSTFAADAKIAGLDIGAWLTTSGISAPVNGILDASAHASGAPATPAFTANATVRNGVVGRYALDHLSVAASGDRSGARIERLELAGPALLANAHGTFGYGAHDPLALAVHAQSNDLAQLAKNAGLVVDVAGSATTDLTLGGTRSAPRLGETLVATDLTLHGYRVPHVAADVVADPQSVSLRSATVDLQKGRMLVAGAVPIAVTPVGIALREAPLSARLQADGVDLAQFAGLLPKGSHLAGIVAGTVTAGGTVHAPSLGGGLALSGGNYSSPQVRSSLANVRAQLAFAGTGANLNDLHADVNGGTLDVAGSASVGDLRDPMHALAFDVTATMSHAKFDIANEFAGKIDSSLHATQKRGGVPALAGTIAISQARIPLSAVIPPSKPSTAATPLPIGFALAISLGDDVRLQSQNVDIGARGRVAIAGTLAQPQLTGVFSSTDGTVSFYRTFVLRHGRVAFSPADGIVPDVDATATTTIPDPATNVLLHVTGPATHLNLELASEPSYDREQILGLLVNAQALGAVRGVATTGSGSGISAVGLASGYLSETFTRQLLQPIGGEVGRSLGLSDLALGYDINAGVTVGATRKLGKHLNLSVNQSLGADQRQSLALEAHLKSGASVQLSVFGSSARATQALPLTSPVAPYAPTGGTNLQLEALAPAAGSSGFVLTYLRKFR